MQDTYILHEPDADKTDYGIPKLLSQENPLARSPLRFTTISSNKQLAVIPFWDEMQRLQKIMNKELRPELYGRSFSYILFILNFSNHDDVYTTVRHEYFHEEADVRKDVACNHYIRPRLKTGKLSQAKNELKLSFDRYYTRSFGEQPLKEQKETMKTELSEIINILADKLKKKKITYNIELFREDVEIILNKW